MIRRWLTAAAFAAGSMIGGAAPAPAQDTTAARSAPSWNDSTTRMLVGRAVARRAQQLADTGLRDYTARATGYLTFLGQLGEGFTEPPRILKADQLALDVQWRAPNLSKQRIVGRRDTLLLPTDINYHRDHLGIVQNNFPEIIRLGDGDEVRDVPHPLSLAGLGAYDFRIADSLRITLPGRVLDVYEVKVRPRDDRLARVIGAVFIEREAAQVVRMAFSFTRAAFLDRQLEDLSIVLENGLVDTRFWLPRRQEIEIRRAGTWLDYPARGIIRGRWEIGNYVLNTGLAPERFVGAEIVSAPPAELRAYAWQGQVLDSLPPDVRATTDADVARVQEEARALVREQALQRARGTSLAARHISDLVRANRVEGLAMGAGLTRRLGGGLSVTARARYGVDDARLKGAATVAWQRASGVGVRVSGYDDFAQAGDALERSELANTLAAQEFGSDHTDPYGVRGTMVELTTGPRLGLRWTLGGALERQRALRVNADAAWGTHEPTLAFAPLEARHAFLRGDRATSLGPWGTELRFGGALRVTGFSSVGGGPVGIPSEALVLGAAGGDDAVVTRGSFDLELERPFGTRRLVSRTIAAAAAGPALPPQSLAFFGGQVTGPGYDYHELAARRGVSQRLEWQFPVPFPAVSLGRFGRTPARVVVASFAHAVAIDGTNVALWRGSPSAGVVPVRLRPGGVYPAVGVGALTLFEMVRLDVARGLRNGRWTFGIDVAREFWRIL